MDTGVTHRQHYVWRKYLSQWATPKSSEGMVYCEMFGQSKKRINLTKICLENDMYQLQKLNDEEIKIILYIAKTKIEIVDQSNEEWVRKNQEFFQMKEALLSLDHTEETKKKLEDSKILLVRNCNHRLKRYFQNWCGIRFFNKNKIFY